MDFASFASNFFHGLFCILPLAKIFDYEPENALYR
ncbi:hypothetical protein SGRA_3556 [Saprospira grandis str. Lewin]|uniref:Uncharacterized protein n=1 Tax=Saprospira grandis (strain Lewin) TaxID=984262 RepID=H6L0B6_SAPGL|nr:hypothetical protein SGRA_3556 [Saprospira grandis str. Lewin]